MVVVVISGKPTSGSSTVGKLLANKLGVRYFSAGEVYKAIATKNVPGHLTEVVTKFLSSSEGSDIDLHKRIDKLQIDLAKEGNCVIEAKLGIYFSGKYADLTVWLEASDEERARRVCEREGIEFEEAIELIKERDKVERNQFMKIYGIDTWSQRDMADLVIDTTNLSPDEVVEKIINELKSRGKIE